MQPSSPSPPPVQQPPYQYPYPPPGQGPYYPPPAAPPPPPPSKTFRNVAIVIVVLVVVAAIVVVMEYRSATLVVTVTSNHITNTVTFILSVDGRQVDSGTLTPLQSVQDSVPLTWWVDSCSSHTTSATSSGGGLGPESDSATGITCSGGTYTASLSI